MTILFSNYISNYFQINHKNKFDINLITIFIWLIDCKKNILIYFLDGILIIFNQIYFYSIKRKLIAFF